MGGGCKAMKKWNLVIDVALCENCNCCLLACKDEYVGNRYEGYSEEQPRHGQRWMNIMTKERGHGSLVDVAYLPIPCMHCDDPACIKKSKNSSIYKREDGIVIIDPVKAKGDRELASACPYGAIWWNDTLEVPQKCTFCAHLLDDGHAEPRCVQACPTGALKVFRTKDSEMQEILNKENLEELHPEFGTKPRVRYKNLYRYTECFIAGSVSFVNNDVKECAVNAKLSLLNAETLVAKTQTDFFGDFKFDKIPQESGEYMIVIQFQNYAKTVQVEIGESVYLEEIALS
jgi:Fe-S-cluster-containing dehydrogenase component